MSETTPQLDQGGHSHRFHFDGGELYAPEGANPAAVWLATVNVVFGQSSVTGSVPGFFCLVAMTDVGSFQIASLIKPIRLGALAEMGKA